MSNINNFGSLIFTIPIDDTYYNKKNNSIKTNYLNNGINYYNSINNFNINLNYFYNVNKLDFKKQIFIYNLNNKETKSFKKNEIILFTKQFLTHNWKTKIKKFAYKSKIKFYNLFKGNNKIFN